MASQSSDSNVAPNASPSGSGVEPVPADSSLRAVLSTLNGDTLLMFAKEIGKISEDLARSSLAADPSGASLRRIVEWQHSALARPTAVASGVTSMAEAVAQGFVQRDTAKTMRPLGILSKDPPFFTAGAATDALVRTWDLPHSQIALKLPQDIVLYVQCYHTAVPLVFLTDAGLAGADDRIDRLEPTRKGESENTKILNTRRASDLCLSMPSFVVAWGRMAKLWSLVNPDRTMELEMLRMRSNAIDMYSESTWPALRLALVDWLQELSDRARARQSITVECSITADTLSQKAMHYNHDGHGLNLRRPDRDGLDYKLATLAATSADLKAIHETHRKIAEQLVKGQNVGGAVAKEVTSRPAPPPEGAWIPIPASQGTRLPETTPHKKMKSLGGQPSPSLGLQPRWCSICNAVASHKPSECTAPVNADLRATGKAPISFSDGRTACLTFQFRPCAGKTKQGLDCSRGHSCTLCSSSEHGAAQCPQKADLIRDPKFAWLGAIPSNANPEVARAATDIHTDLHSAAWLYYFPNGCQNGVQRQKVPHDIIHGSTLGIHQPVAHSFYPANRIKGPAEETAFEAFLAKELTLGRLAGPFSRDHLEATLGPCRSAPISLVPKSPALDGTPRFRIVEDFSHPRREVPRANELPAINTQLDPADYLCDWTTFAHLRASFSKLGPNHEVCGFDIRDAFHHIPVHPSVRPSLTIEWQGRHYIRKVVPFGLRTAPGVFGQLADLTRALLKNYHEWQFFRSRESRSSCWSQESSVDGLRDEVQVWNQVDDFVIARDKVTQSSVSTFTINRLLDELGWVRAPEKGFTWTRRFTHAGIVWDLDARTVSLAEDKRVKYIARLSHVVASPHSTSFGRSDIEPIIGYLSYVCQIVPDRRHLLFHLYGFRRDLRSPYDKRKLNRNIRDLLSEWIFFLQQAPVSADLDDLECDSKWQLYSDASNTGLGVWVAHPDIERPLVAFWELIDNWRVSLAADIGPAEAWALEAAIDAAILMGERKVILTAHCDNMGVVLAWRKGWSRSYLTNRTFGRLHVKLSDAQLSLHVEYVNTADNPADAVSRGAELLHIGDPLDLDLHPVGTVAGVL